MSVLQQRHTDLTVVDFVSFVIVVSEEHLRLVLHENSPAVNKLSMDLWPKDWGALCFGMKGGEPRKETVNPETLRGNPKP